MDSIYKNKIDLIFVIFLIVYSCLVLVRANDPIRTNGDYFGDEFAYQSAIHFAQDGFANNKYLMNRNYGSESRNFYFNHAGFYTYAYGLAYRWGFTSLGAMRVIAYSYFLILIMGLYFLVKTLTREPVLALLSVAISCFNPIVFAFADILEGTAYITPLVFWNILLYHVLTVTSLKETKKFIGYLLFIVTIFIDARFSHQSIIYTIGLICIYNVCYFKKELFKKRIIVAGIALLAMFLSTALYQYQSYLVNGINLRTLANYVLRTFIDEQQNISGKVNIFKVLYYCLVVPPFLLMIIIACMGGILSIRNIKCYAKDIKVALLVGCGLAPFVIMLFAKWLQHIQYYLPIFIFASSIVFSIILIAVFKSALIRKRIHSWIAFILLLFV
ncbi:hypothetical protein ACFL3D_06610, partial [Candidatus Omnitrophota bacterium]